MVGIVINPETGESKWKLSELDPDVSKVITKMNINEISKPFKTIDDKQRPVYKIVKLINKTNAHQANLRDDYVELSNIYMASKKKKLLTLGFAKNNREPMFTSTILISTVISSIKVG